MLTLPAELMNLIVAFAPLFSKPVFEHAKVLLVGAILSPGKRTVSACLRVCGKSQEKNFQNYHRLLNRARWSALTGSRILLQLLLEPVMNFRHSSLQLIVEPSLRNTTEVELISLTIAVSN